MIEKIFKYSFFALLLTLFGCREIPVKKDDLLAEIYAGSCHNPQTWLLNGSEVVIAVASDVVGFHEDIVFLLVPHQFAIYLGVWMIAIHSLLPSYAPRC